MDECIFCKISRGDIPCAKIYEDDEFIAFADINPISRGHTLIVPKEHSPTVFEMETHEGNAVLALVQKLGKALMNVCESDGMNVGINVNPAAGQVVMHTHIHLIPRYKGDGLKSWPGNEADPEDLAKFAAEVATLL